MIRKRFVAILGGDFLSLKIKLIGNKKAIHFMKEKLTFFFKASYPNLVKEIFPEFYNFANSRVKICVIFEIASDFIPESILHDKCFMYSDVTVFKRDYTLHKGFRRKDYKMVLPQSTECSTKFIPNKKSLPDFGELENTNLLDFETLEQWETRMGVINGTNNY